MTATRAAEPPWFHLVRAGAPAVFLVPGSMLFDIDEELFAALDRDELDAVSQIRTWVAPTVTSDVLPPVTALSLNVAQACNLACSYCYADEGRYGGKARLMDKEIAFHGIDLLIASAQGKAVTVGFIGGEPFLNRELVHASVSYARAAARRAGIAVKFALTTNATLLNANDVRLLRDHGFAVTVSVDGGAAQNRHRPRYDGGDSTDAALVGVGPLLADPGKARVSARATVTRDNLDVVSRIEALIGAGFQDVGVSPVRSGPRADLVLREDDWPSLLANMTSAAVRELARIDVGEPPRFSNLWVALRSIHRGAARPLPCGSAASYLSLDVDGGIFSCHRTINQPNFSMGSLDQGLDGAARSSFLTKANVDGQEPCNSCWARYLCGGGCHAEVAAAGRSGCDFIRGWLDYCLTAYRQVADRHPSLLRRGLT